MIHPVWNETINTRWIFYENQRSKTDQSFRSLMGCVHTEYFLNSLPSELDVYHPSFNGNVFTFTVENDLFLHKTKPLWHFFFLQFLHREPARKTLVDFSTTMREWINLSIWLIITSQISSNLPSTINFQINNLWILIYLTY